jgi:WD40 repeat protein
VWDVATGKLLYQVPSKNPSSVAFSPDGNTLAIGEENSVTLWDASSGKFKKSIGSGVGGVQMYRGLAFSADGKSLYVAFDDQQVRQADIDSGRLTDLFSLPKDGCCVFISPNTQTLLVSRPNHGGGTKELWDVQNGALLKSLGNCDNDTTLEVFSQDGSHFVIGPCGGAQLWDTRSGKMLHLIANPPMPNFYPEWRGAAFSPDGSQIALGNDLGQIFLWDTTTYEQLKMWTLPLPATPLASAFSVAFSHP